MSEVLLSAFPKSHESDYTVCSDRKNGERELGKIASTSLREYLWVFDGTDDVWHHHVAESTIEQETLGSELISSSMRLKIPQQLALPPFEDASFYHIHPSLQKPFHLAEMRLQLPSREDVIACAEQSFKGYKDFRIVTELGVTTMKLSQSALSTGAVSAGFNIKNDFMQELFDTNSITVALRRVINELDCQLDGSIHVSFDEFEFASDSD